MKKDLAHYSAQFEDISAFLDHATQKVRENHSLNLESLNKRIATLCVEIRAEGGSLARDAQPFMSDVIAKLDELEQALKDFHAAHSKRIKT